MGVLHVFSSCPLTRELAPILEHRADYSVSWSFTSVRTPWTSDQLVARPLPKHRATQTQKNADTQWTSMIRPGFERTSTATERTKTVHASDRTATATGSTCIEAPRNFTCRGGKVLQILLHLVFRRSTNRCHVLSNKNNFSRGKNFRHLPLLRLNKLRTSK
jgi:hypothetical protein